MQSLPVEFQGPTSTRQGAVLEVVEVPLGVDDACGIGTPLR